MKGTVEPLGVLGLLDGLLRRGAAGKDERADSKTDEEGIHVGPLSLLDNEAEERHFFDFFSAETEAHVNNLYSCRKRDLRTPL